MPRLNILLALVLPCWLAGTRSYATEILKYNDFSGRSVSSIKYESGFKRHVMCGNERVLLMPANRAARGYCYYEQTLAPVDRLWRKAALERFRAMDHATLQELFYRCDRLIVTVSGDGAIVAIKSVDNHGGRRAFGAALRKPVKAVSMSQTYEPPVELLRDLRLDPPPSAPCQFVLHLTNDLRFVKHA